MKLHVITRCTRPEFLLRVQDSLCLEKFQDVDINWHIIFDTSGLKEVSTTLLSKLVATKYFWEGTPGDMGHSLINRVLDIIDDGWVYILDDDNIMHPKLLEEIVYNYQHLSGLCEGYIFMQFVNFKDFTNQKIRKIDENNVKPQHIDMAQFLLKRSLIGDHRFVPNTYIADGIFIEKIYNENRQNFHFIHDSLCYYNYLQESFRKQPAHTLPRILHLGTPVDLKSFKSFEFESDELNILNSTNATALEDIANFNPDCILTTGEDFKQYPALSQLSYDFRQRWIHCEEPVPPTLGETAYNCATNYILGPITDTLISIATPVYNTKEKIRRTYQSLVAQSFTNWEWVIVNDSTDTVTIEIVNEIANIDPRVKVYDFKEKSKGIIGEAKYRAFSLSRGNYIIELDHDDYLLPHALQATLDAFEKYPDAGFVYSDCAEVDEQYNSLTYGDGFSFGYGSYREEEHLGITFKVANTANINPMTIRHIVGVPNHLRAWRRDIYFKIGGHNRRLSIADDYELIVRTFLETKFTKIAKCCYLQFYHDSNSQNSTRADIQRRVRSISWFYSQKIKARFEELGKEDWAYNESGLSWDIQPRFGDEEHYVNYII